MKKPKLKPPPELLPAGLKAMLEFTIPGPPVGKARARVTRHGTYTPKETRDYEDHIRSIGQTVVMQNRDFRLIASTAPTEFWFILEVNIHYPDGRWPDPHNVTGSILDALQGVIWANDNKVMDRVMRVTLGSSNPRVDVRIMKIAVLEQIT